MAVDVRELARAAGIDPDYTSWRGAPTSASDEAVRAALCALGPDLGIDFDAMAPEAAFAAIEARTWAERVPPVVVAWDGELVVPMRVPAETEGAWSIDVVTEDGRAFAARGTLFELRADRHACPGGKIYCVRTAELSLDGALGYHELVWSCGEETGTALVIAAPTRAWGSPGNFARRWGVFAPVYGLASRASGHAGDLGTLRTLFEQVAARGGAYVATLPILAAFLDEPCAFSPYSPASRLFWNEMYLELSRFGADLGVAVPEAPPYVAGSIDYRAQYAWRRPVIDRLATAFFADPERTAAVERWATQYGVFDYAAFRAIGERQGRGWRGWPAELRDGTKPARSRAEAVALAGGLAEDAARIDSHVFAQWAMHSQLSALQGGAVALYLDLPVGVSLDAYEVWRWRRLFLPSLAAGAPPDALFLGGQNWGLPPMSPIALRRGRYKYFIDCVRHHMRVAGMLRIDHVMGLFRLYCVPEGRPATDGVYLRYPAEDLLAILTLESRRATCALCGEDLGTVPPDVRPAMHRHGLYRLHVGQWSFPRHAGQPSEEAPPGSIASLNTHDTATFAGWWTGADITDKLDLALIDEREARHERIERAETQQAVLALAPVFGESPKDDRALADIERALIGATAELAAGQAEVVLVSLDDLALEPVPHNVPGTTLERPNWSHRVTQWAEALDEATASPVAAETIAAVVAARRSR
ncbi:MAG: 4-alpha-glucanotransferase [Kofleriaceae bacterium]